MRPNAANAMTIGTKRMGTKGLSMPPVSAAPTPMRRAVASSEASSQRSVTVRERSSHASSAKPETSSEKLAPTAASWWPGAPEWTSRSALPSAPTATTHGRVRRNRVATARSCTARKGSTAFSVMGGRRGSSRAGRHPSAGAALHPRDHGFPSDAVGAPTARSAPFSRRRRRRRWHGPWRWARSKGAST
ncbi:MAG: hypothetical protein M5U28_05765 [Sandaracinaceae bacterium]|nr:hypothetical protein [Sandaracinaceae bacterium]